MTDLERTARRRCLTRLAMTAMVPIAGIAPRAACAQAFPSRPIRLLVGMREESERWGALVREANIKLDRLARRERRRRRSGRVA